MLHSGRIGATEMSTGEMRARIDAAKTTADELAAVVGGEGRDGLVWQQRLRQVAADLAVADAPEREVLDAARERFDSMYAGVRNFSDFHICRTDPAERVAANEELSSLVERLRDLLHTR
jgi:hypothetical protein